MPLHDTIHLVPETILPVQFLGAALGGARLQPEKRLQNAVLADAILTFRRCLAVARPRARRLLGEVDDWFASNDTDGPFTFVTICDSLGLDPAYIRRGLVAWRVGGMTHDPSTRPVRRDSGGTRHQVVVPRLRRVA